jgi:hypothetical protein
MHADAKGGRRYGSNCSNGPVLSANRDAAGAPSFERICLAFATAPATAAIPCALGISLLLAFHHATRGWSAVLGGAFLVGMWAYPVALVLGVPTYVLLRERIPLRPIRSAAVGTAIGGLATTGFLSVAAPQLRDGLYLRGLIGWPHLLGVGLVCGDLARSRFLPDRDLAAEGVVKSHPPSTAPNASATRPTSSSAMPG